MLDDDGLPLNEVGAWAREKHERLKKYVDITRATRRKFVTGEARGGYTGGASYIDLYCGPGRSIIRESDERIDGSPLVAFKSAIDGGVPFSEIFLADSSEDWCRAAEQRMIGLGARPAIEVGPADFTVRRIVPRLGIYGLHFAFLDPFNLQDLPFSVIEALSPMRHIDILIHVSAQDLQRNLDAYAMSDASPLDRFAPGWRNAVDLRQSQAATRAAFMTYWASKIEALWISSAGACGTCNRDIKESAAILARAGQS